MIASLKFALVLVLIASLASAAPEAPAAPKAAPIAEDDFAPAGLDAAALTAAPALTVEKLGVAQAMARIIGQYTVPGTKEYPARYIVSFGPYGSASVKGVETATYIVNLSDGAFRRMEGAPWDKVALRWPSARDAQGRLYISCMHGELVIYDPRDDTMKVTRPIEKSGWLRGVAVGTDGACYVSAYPSGASGRYDPETGETEDYGRQGGPYKINYVYGYSVGAEGDWVYTASGKVPWYVVAYNRTTKQQTILFTLDQADFPNVYQRGDEVYLVSNVRDMATGKYTRTDYRLKDGAAEKVDRMPNYTEPERPWTNVPQPKVQTEVRAYPVKDGKVTLTWTTPAAEGEAPKTRTAELPYSGEPYRIGRLAPGRDGGVLLSTNPYGDVSEFRPEKNAYEPIGNPAGRNVYDLLSYKDTVWFCGYASSLIGAFTDQGAKILYSWAGMLGQKHCWYMAPAADGKIYLGCHAEREFVGGALAWYDPETKEPGGVRFPNDDCNDLATALDGRYVVYSSFVVDDPVHPEATPDGASLFIYDTQKGDFAHRVMPLPGEKANGRVKAYGGVIVEATPGVILALTAWHGKPCMVTVDVRTGLVNKRVLLPAGHKGKPAKGPDGKVYVFLGDTLCRIDPTTLAVAAVGQVPGAAGRMVFSGPDLYLSGDIELRRIKGVAE